PTLLRSNSCVMRGPAVSETSAAAGYFLVGHPEYPAGRRIEVGRRVVAPTLMPEARIKVVDQATRAARNCDTSRPGIECRGRGPARGHHQRILPIGRIGRCPGHDRAESAIGGDMRIEIKRRRVQEE